MLAANVPGRIALPFANGAGVDYKNSIPVASQIGVTPGAASYTDGFPPLCFLPLTAGGIAPAGADFNGLLNAITAVQQWQSAGGLFHYDATFSTAIGGYPSGAMIISTSNTTNWLNLADNNTTNPDATDGSAANWVSAGAYGISAITGLTNANITLLPGQWSKPIIVLTGTLTANINIIFPVTAQEWLVVNNTTGAFVATCKTAIGTGAPVAQGGGQQTFWGDGTNLNPLSGNSGVPFTVGTATAPTHAINQGVGDARYAPITAVGAAIQGAFKNLAAFATGTSAPVTITADEIVVESTANSYQTLRAVNVTLSLATSGANGLDTGTSAANTWYALWVIWNGTTNAGLLSLSATAPTLPAGYTHKARVGWIRADGTANKYPLAFKQSGRNVQYTCAAGSNVTVLPQAASGAAGSAGTSLVAVALSSFVPPTASRLDYKVTVVAGQTVQVSPNAVASTFANGIKFSSVGTCNLSASFLLETLTVYWASDSGSGNLNIQGWEDNL